MTSKTSAGGGNRLPRLHLTAVKYTVQFEMPTIAQEAAQTLSLAIQDQPQANMVPGHITITTQGQVVRTDPSDPPLLTLSSYSRVLERTKAALRFASCMLFYHRFTMEGLFTPGNQAFLVSAVYTTLSEV